MLIINKFKKKKSKPRTQERKPIHPPSAERPPAWQRRDARLSHLLLGTSPKSMVSSRETDPSESFLPVGILSKQLLGRIHKQTAIKLKITFEGNNILEGFITEVQTRTHMFLSTLWWSIHRACNKMRGWSGIQRIRSKQQINNQDIFTFHRHCLLSQQTALTAVHLQ